MNESEPPSWDMRPFDSLRWADVRGHRACGKQDCLRCKATGIPGAMAHIEAREARRLADEVQERLHEARRTGLGLTKAHLRQHKPCGSRHCLLCKATADWELMALLPEGAPAPAARPSKPPRGRVGPRTLAAPLISIPPESSDSVLARRDRLRQPLLCEYSSVGLGGNRTKGAACGCQEAGSSCGCEGSAGLPGLDVNPPKLAATSREEEVEDRGACPPCKESIDPLSTPNVYELAYSNKTLYVSIEGGSKGLGTPMDPLSFSTLQDILNQPIFLPGTTFLLDPTLPYDAFKYYDDRDSTKITIVGEANKTTECWKGETWAALLPIQASGTEGRPLTLTTWASGVGAPPATSETAPRALFDGRNECATALCTNQVGRPRHVGVNLINACHVHIHHLSLRRWHKAGIMLSGSCRNVEVSYCSFEDSHKSGLRAGPCPDLDRESEPWDPEEEGDACVGTEGYTTRRQAVLTTTAGYPAEVEVHHCVFRDNGSARDSSPVQLGMKYYCTNFHIHHNLFYNTPVPAAWSSASEPPQTTLLLHLEDDDGLDCKPNNARCDPAKSSCTSDGCVPYDPACLSTGTPTYKHCTGTDGHLDSAEAEARSKELTGDVGEDYPGCQRRGADAITMQGASSGHRIEYNVIVGHHKNCGARVQFAQLNPTAGDSYPYGGTLVNPDNEDTQPEQIPSCWDTSDGDGIDFKDVRPRTPDSGPVTVVAHNLFLFNEGPAIGTHNGTMGLVIHRNVIVGNGGGIHIQPGDTTLYFDEPLALGRDGETKYIEQGNYQIYRNLIYDNNRVDRSCRSDGRGMGTGIQIIENGHPEQAGTKYSTLLKDVWIANNVIAGHGSFGIDIRKWAPDSGLSHTVEGLHILNNLVVNNAGMLEEAGDANPVQLFLGSGTDVELAFEATETTSWTIDRNWYWPPRVNPLGQEVTVTWNGDSATTWDLWQQTGFESHWESIGFVSSTVPNLPDPHLKTPSESTWVWTRDAWERGWTWKDPAGLLWWGDDFKLSDGSAARPSQWGSLDAARWAPQAMDLEGLSAPPVSQSTVSVGLLDLGIYDRTGQLVDVGDGRDIFYQEVGTTWFAPAKTKTVRRRAVGAWNPVEVSSYGDGVGGGGIFVPPGGFGPNGIDIDVFVPPAGLGPNTRVEPPEQALPELIDWRHIWEAQAFIENQTPIPGPDPIPWAAYITEDTLKWAARAGYVGQSRQVLFNQWVRS